MPSKSAICLIGTGVAGAVFLTVGITFVYVFQNLIKDEIGKEIKLKEDSDAFNDWKIIPVPIYFQVWVFDITNHEEIVQNGDKPYVVQRGPYTYREYREKVNITFNNNNSTVTYREDKWYVFEPDLSVGPESDTFTTVNIPYMTIVNMVRFEYNLLEELVELLLGASGEHLFIELSVSDLLWGYEDKLLKDADEILKRTVNKTIDDRFGLFYNTNGSDDGVYNIYTGVMDEKKFGQITSWNYQSSLSYWTTAQTNMINGTDGSMYPPFRDRTNPIYVFSSDLCRSLYATYSYSYYLRDIYLDRYIIPKETFIADAEHPTNFGFCTPPGNCLPYGLLNVSTCREGAPIVMSQPHFSNCNHTVPEGVDGVHPDHQEYQTVFDVEPMTGVVMNVVKKLQINVFIEPVSKIKDTENIKPAFMPVLWINESAAIDEAAANKYKDQVRGPVQITQAVQYGLIALGVIILLCVIAIIIRRTTCRQNDIPLQDLSRERDALLPSSSQSPSPHSTD